MNNYLRGYEIVQPHYTVIPANYTMTMYDLLNSANLFTVDGGLDLKVDPGIAYNKIASNSAQRWVPVHKDLFEEYDASVFGLDDYPIFKEEFRKPLNDMIIREFLEHEIGYETSELFRQHMRAKMYRIMQAYNPMLRARAEAMGLSNILDTVDLTTVGSMTGSAGNVHKFADTPQGSIDNVSDGYLTNASLDNSNSKTDNKTISTGRSGSAFDLPAMLSEISFDFEERVIKYLRPLFMGLYL